jgi:hypothetical protein
MTTAPLPRAWPRHLQASEITEHWSRSSSTWRAAREPKAQATLELPLAL